MRLRGEILNSLELSIYKHAKTHDLIVIELLLDIRDQNEVIKNQLISMKRYSVNGNDISKIWDEGDNKL